MKYNLLSTFDRERFILVEESGLLIKNIPVDASPETGMLQQTIRKKHTLRTNTSRAAEVCPILTTKCAEIYVV